MALTYDVKEAAEILGISPRFLRQQIKDRKITHIRLGSRILFRRVDLDDFLENHSVPVKPSTTEN